MKDIYIYIYLYTHVYRESGLSVCACVCVCVRDRNRKRQQKMIRRGDRKKLREIENWEVGGREETYPQTNKQTHTHNNIYRE